MLPQLAEKIRHCELRFGIVSFLGSKSILRVELKKFERSFNFDHSTNRESKAIGVPLGNRLEGSAMKADDRQKIVA